MGRVTVTLCVAGHAVDPVDEMNAIIPRLPGRSGRLTAA